MLAVCLGASSLTSDAYSDLSPPLWKQRGAGGVKHTRVYSCSTMCLATDEVTTAVPRATHGGCQEGVLRPRMQHHRRQLPGAAAGLCVPSKSPVCHQRSGTVHRVRDPRLPLGGCRAVCSHRQATDAACGVCPQRQVPSALLGQKLCRVAAVLLASAKRRTPGPAAVGAARQAALAGDTECGCSPFKGRTEKTD